MRACCAKFKVGKLCLFCVRGCCARECCAFHVSKNMICVPSFPCVLKHPDSSSYLVILWGVYHASEVSSLSGVVGRGLW